MKPVILFCFFLTTLLFAEGQTVSTEEKAVQSQIDAFFASWNHHDFSDMKNYVADTSDFVNIVGFHWRGRQDIQYAHQAVHEQLFKNMPLRKLSSHIRMLTNDVAIAHVGMKIDSVVTTPDGSKIGNDEALATFVFIKKQGRWMITAVENVTVSEAAKPFNPITVREKKQL